MATKITSGSIFSAGAVVVGVDADAPPAVPSPSPEQESLVELYLNATDSSVVDSSSNSHTVTINGDVSVVAESPYSTGKSMTFDGSGDYLSVDLGADLIASNTPFTAEFWMYPKNISNRGVLHFTNNPGTLEGRTILYISSAGNLSWFDARVGSAAAGDITPNSGGGITTNEWHHIALTRQSDNYVRIYVDGQLYNTSSNVWDLGLSRYLEIGRYANTAYFDGYISDLRIVKGTAVYTENFTVPTEPVGDYTVVVESPAPEPTLANWVVVGARLDDDPENSGSVYVYDANDLSVQPTKLTAFDGADNDQFGRSVDATSDKIIVGAFGDDDNGLSSGSVYVYNANDLSAQPTKLTAFDGAGLDSFGISVAAASDKIVVGAYGDDDNGSNSGSVYVYDANDLSAQPTKLTAFDGDENDLFGYSVAADSNKIVVGAYGDDDNGTDSGSVYVYDANDLSASPTKLTAPDAAAGDHFGYSVDAASDKIVVGARSDDDNGTDSGSVYVYDANDLTAQPTKLTAPDAAASEYFGYSVAADSDKIVVGAYGDDDNGTNSGAVYVFDANDLTAQPTKLTAFDGTSKDYFGQSVDATSDKIIVGAYGDDDNGTDSGSVYVFDANDLSAQPTKLTAFDGAARDHFGHSVSVG